MKLHMLVRQFDDMSNGKNPSIMDELIDKTEWYARPCPNGGNFHDHMLGGTCDCTWNTSILAAKFGTYNTKAKSCGLASNIWIKRNNITLTLS